MPEAITIHTDGACSGNPGPGGFAAIVEWDPHSPLTVSGGDPDTTNNRMELSAVIEALRAVNFTLVERGWRTEDNDAAPHADPVEITVRSDSKYVTDAFNKGWIKTWQTKGWRGSKGPVVSPELWKALLLEIRGHDVTWVWVKGHSGDPMNERCDQLAVRQAQFARSQPGYWSSAGNPATEAAATVQPAAQAAAPSERPVHVDIPGGENTYCNIPGSLLPEEERITAVEASTNNGIEQLADASFEGGLPEEYCQFCAAAWDAASNEEFLGESPEHQAGYGLGYERGRRVAQEQQAASQDSERNTAHAAGYEACRQELFQFLSNLSSGPPPSFGDYISGYNDCRKELLEFQSRMKYDDLPF